MAKSPTWKLFEAAVAQFMAALDPSAVVKHDVSLPDRHTGTPRQRDIWIETKLPGGHIPVLVLVSCKRCNRRLDISDVDAFSGELQSSIAHVGVLYSYSGFTQPAIEKCKALRIACCRLYQDAAPELPEVLSFDAYCCCPQLAPKLLDVDRSSLGNMTWGDVFSLPVDHERGTRQAIDAVVEAFHRAEKDLLHQSRPGSRFPRSFECETVVVPRESSSPLMLRACCSWKFYRARLDAFLVNGSYEFTAGDFKGQVATPAIDMRNAEPGPGWERIDHEVVMKPGTIVAVLSGDVKETLLTLAPAAIVRHRHE